jgi:hypothetical protein
MKSAIVAICLVATAANAQVLTSVTRAQVDAEIKATPSNIECPNVGTDGICIEYKCNPWITDGGIGLQENPHANAPCQRAGDACQNGLCPTDFLNMSDQVPGAVAYCVGQLHLPPLPDPATQYCVVQTIAAIQVFCQGDTGNPDPGNGGEP